MVKILMARPSPEEFAKHRAQEPHKLENSLRDVILGGQDGLVNALGIILGVLVGGGNTHILITTVLAASIAESLSMGAVAYTSAISQKDYYEAEKKKALKEIEDSPAMEIEEVRQIYEKKGFKGKVLEEITQTISSNKDIWLEIMMAEELHIEPVNTKRVFKSSIVVTIATAIGHLIPLIPFFFVVSNQEALILSIGFSAASLFAVGAYQALTLVGSWWKNGLRLMLIGLAAAFIGYFIAKIFHVSAA